MSVKIRAAGQKSPVAKEGETMVIDKLSTTGKETYQNRDFCIDCLYLPSDLNCLVKTEGEITPVHITTHACLEFKERVIW